MFLFHNYKKKIIMYVLLHSKVYKAKDPNDWSGLVWPGNTTTIPSDSPPCGWRGEFCHVTSNNAIVAIVISLFVIIIIFATVGFLGYRKIR